MVQQDHILLGAGQDGPAVLLPQMVCRHGLIAGATGTGKTVTLKVLAEGLSTLGVPVFLADIKGDVSGTALSGTRNEKLDERLRGIGQDPEAFAYQSFPCRFFDVFGRRGIPVRASVSAVGPVLLARLMELSDVQEGVLTLVFKIADDRGWKLIDLKDLRSMLTWTASHAAEFTTTYGNMSSASIGAIQRALVGLENAGATSFFGEPELDVNDWIATAADGRGEINILHCAELYQQPLLYSTVMLWMLSELFEILPEAGEVEKPKLVFFFDEAHLLFEGAPKVLVEKITQVVKLVRSKGVGVWFISQSPSDLPDTVLAQLNNRIQHALRAYTPTEQKAVRAAAQSFRANPAFDTTEAISSLGTGCALVSCLDADGIPDTVRRVTICPPQSSMAALDDGTRAQLIAMDPLNDRYKTAVDNLSAYEILQPSLAKQEEDAQAAAEEKQAAAEEKARRAEEKALQAQYRAEGRDRNGRSAMEKNLRRAASSTARSVGRSVGRQITRGVLGTGNRTLTNAAGTLVGSLLGDLFR